MSVGTCERLRARPPRIVIFRQRCAEPSQDTLRDRGGPRSPIIAQLLIVLAITMLTPACNSQIETPVEPRTFHVGVLINRDYQPWHDEIRAALSEEGFIDGQNLHLEYRNVQGSDQDFDEIAAEFVATGLDVLVVANTPLIAASQRATQTVPIVMASSADPVWSGFVRSLKEPGSNITGIATMSPEMAAKRLELLKEVVHGLQRVAILYDPGNDVRQLELEYSRAVATQFGIEVDGFPVRGASDINDVFDALHDWGAGAAMVFSDAPLSANRTQVINGAAVLGLPAMYERDQWVEAGGLLSYGPSLTYQYHRAGEMVAKILKGTRPADIPVELPPRFELTVNISVARDLNVPASIVRRADRVVP